jgi:hypothetical protein
MKENIAAEILSRVLDGISDFPGVSESYGSSCVPCWYMDRDAGWVRRGAVSGLEGCGSMAGMRPER